MTPLDLIPRLVLYAAILGLSGLAGVQSWRLHKRTGQLSELRLVVAQERERASTAAAQASEAARFEERRRTAAHQGVINEAENRSRASRLGAAAAVHAGDGLRQYGASLAASCGATASDPPAASASAPASNPAVVLAGLLDSTITEAVRLAALADERGIAGQACVGAYQGLTP